MTHFVYVYAKAPAVWDELHYSVLSIRKFFKGDFKIFVYGDDPKIKGVTWIKTDKIRTEKNSKTTDINSKILKIANNKEINEDFVYLYDDIILLRPCTEVDFKSTRAMDYASKPGAYFGPNAKPSRTWINQWLKTMLTLKQYQLPTWNYETHLPRWYNKTQIREVMERYRVMDNVLLFASLYFNTLYVAPDESLDQNKTIKAGLYDPHEKAWIDRNVPGKLFLNYDNVGLNQHLKDFIKTLLK
jgi:hypothetical protein